MSAWFTPYPTTGWWRHSFIHLHNRNHRADDVFSAFSYVRCVKFSADGEYLATSCERTAQIYDTKTWAKIWFGPFLVDGPLALTPSLLHSGLVHETMGGSIYSVCFSPDGKLLATGARDGVVRVSSRITILAIVIAVIIIFGANAQHGMVFGALDLGYRQGGNQIGRAHV